MSVLVESSRLNETRLQYLSTDGMRAGLHQGAAMTVQYSDSGEMSLICLDAVTVHRDKYNR